MLSTRRWAISRLEAPVQIRAGSNERHRHPDGRQEESLPCHPDTLLRVGESAWLHVQAAGVKTLGPHPTNQGRLPSTGFWMVSQCTICPSRRTGVSAVCCQLSRLCFAACLRTLVCCRAGTRERMTTRRFPLQHGYPTGILEQRARHVGTSLHRC